MNAPWPFAAALTSLPRMSPRRLRLLLDHHAPGEAWQVATGQRTSHSVAVAHLLSDGALAAQWRLSAQQRGPDEAARQCQQAGVTVMVRGYEGYPDLLVDDPAAPAVLFAKGQSDVLEARRVGIVGTRNATAAGRAMAHDLGRDLAAASVVVVSGLARGIDGAAHRGVLAAGGRPVGVVASGLDVVYPREHHELWHHVAHQGLLLGESPPGTAPEAYRFPLRNRILAALCEVLVVVESRARGGSLLTTIEAVERGIPVMAVPGSVRIRSAEGTNDLLADGATPVRDVGDVLVALGLDHRRREPPARRRAPQGLDGHLLSLLVEGPAGLGELVERSGQPLAAVALALGRLEASGWLVATGGWFEACNMTSVLP